MSPRDATAAGVETADDEPARARVRALLQWGGAELDLLSSAFRGCSTDQLAAIVAAQRGRSLPAAYHEFLRLAGVGGVGSALAEIFPGDDVDVESLLPNGEWVGLRALAEELVQTVGAAVDLDGQVVIRLHRLAEFDYVDAAVPDPPVWHYAERKEAPVLEADTFTSWLERRIGRAIKRRYPLRDAHFPQAQGGDVIVGTGRSADQA